MHNFKVETYFKTYNISNPDMDYMMVLKEFMTKSLDTCYLQD